MKLNHMEHIDSRIPRTGDKRDGEGGTKIINDLAQSHTNTPICNPLVQTSRMAQMTAREAGNYRRTNGYLMKFISAKINYC